jgi:flagellar protein FlbD
MITVTRLNGTELVVNDEQIEFLEKTPETVISLTTGKKITVRETTEEVLKRIVEFRRQCSLPEVKE